MSKQRITRRELVRLTAVAGAGVIAACAPAAPKEAAKAPTKPSEPVASQTPGTQPAPAAESVTLHYAHWGPPDEAKANIDLAAAFEERNPGLKVEINHIPNVDFYPKILTLISAGTPPDVFYSGEAMVFKWGATTAAKDLVPFIERDGIDESIWFEAGVQQLKNPQGQLHGMPTYLGPFMAYYNKDIFDEVGVEYPITDIAGDWSFDDVRTKGERLVKKGADGRIERYATEPWAHWLHWIPTIHSFGGDILNEDLTECLMDQPEAVDAIQWLADNMLVHKIAPSPLVLTEMGQSGMDLVLGGKVAVWGAGRWGAWALHDQETGQPKLNWGVAPWPAKVASRTPVLFVAFVLSAASKHASEGWEFIKFTTATMDGQLLWNSNGLGVPILKEAANAREYLFDYEPRTNHDIYYRSLERARALPYHAEWDKTIDTYAVEELQLVWIGEATGAQACKRIAERINEELAG